MDLVFSLNHGVHNAIYLQTRVHAREPCRGGQISKWCHRRRFVRTTDSNHALPIAPNFLEQQVDQTSAPNQIRVTDITYVPTDEGWLCVAAIKDSFTKKIVGTAMEDNMRTELVSKAPWIAVKQERPKPGLIHHAERGSRYASLEYRHELVQSRILASMSRQGNCYDNAPMELLGEPEERTCALLSP